MPITGNLPIRSPFLSFNRLGAARDAKGARISFVSGYPRAVSISHTDRVSPEASRRQVLCETFINDCPAPRYLSSTEERLLKISQARMEVRTATTGYTDSSASEEHFRRQFLFVPGVCNQNSRSSRSHVQIEYRRQQRWQKTRELHSRKSVPKGWIHLTRLPTRSNLFDPSIASSSSSKSTQPVPGRCVPTASKPDCDEEPVLPKNSAKAPVPEARKGLFEDKTVTTLAFGTNRTPCNIFRALWVFSGDIKPGRNGSGSPL
jgi:hypothetical protein